MPIESTEQNPARERAEPVSSVESGVRQKSSWLRWALTITTPLRGLLTITVLRIGAIVAESISRPVFEAVHGASGYLTIEVFGLGVSLYSFLIMMAVMTAFSMIIYPLWNHFYDKLKKDIYFMEALKRRSDGNEKSFLRKLPYAFGLSVVDPLLATWLLRMGIEKYNGFSKRDWTALAAFTILNSGLWSLVWSGIIGALAGLLPPAIGFVAFGVIAAAILWEVLESAGKPPMKRLISLC